MEGADGERTEEELVAQGRSFPSFFFFNSLTPREGARANQWKVNWTGKKKKTEAEWQSQQTVLFFFLYLFFFFYPCLWTSAASGMITGPSFPQEESKEETNSKTGILEILWCEHMMEVKQVLVYFSG